MKDINILEVSQLSFYIKSIFDSDNILSNIFLRGEVSNFKNHYSSGHLYFSLKDDKSIIKVVMFSKFASRIKFDIADGQRVIVRGKVSVYEATGQYQLYAEDMQIEGVGELYFAFENLKKKLEKEGLFNLEHKNPIPKLPRRVGIITSPTGAAIEDIKNVLHRRFPSVEIVLCPVLVQGENAAGEIIDAINRFNRSMAADVLIVGRGGGSIEDLWAFNDENLARAVYSSSIPIISAVGHETDFTICDFVADLRAPTPSAAAELAVPEKTEIKKMIETMTVRAESLIFTKIDSLQSQLDYLIKTKNSHSPYKSIENKFLKLQQIKNSLDHYMRNTFSYNENKYLNLISKLETLSPLKVLSRGYSIAYKNGSLIKSIRDVNNGDKIKLVLKDGEVNCIAETSNR